MDLANSCILVSRDQNIEILQDHRKSIVTTPKFIEGDCVAWTSQAAGVTKSKTGIIEQVVAPKTYPDRGRFLQLYKGPGVGLSRNHESYVVRVPGKTEKSAGKVYWPRANALTRLDS